MVEWEGVGKGISVLWAELMLTSVPSNFSSYAPCRLTILLEHIPVQLRD